MFSAFWIAGVGPLNVSRFSSPGSSSCRRLTCAFETCEVLLISRAPLTRAALRKRSPQTRRGKGGCCITFLMLLIVTPFFPTIRPATAVGRSTCVS